MPPYYIGKLVSPPLFDEINNTMSKNLLQESIEKDIAWAIAGGLPDKERSKCLYTRFLEIFSKRNYQREQEKI